MLNNAATHRDFLQLPSYVVALFCRAPYSADTPQMPVQFKKKKQTLMVTIFKPYEANSSSASQEIPRILRKLKVDYRKRIYFAELA